MGIEHERIHLETSAVIIRRVPLHFLHSDSPAWPICPFQKSSGYLKEKPGVPNVFHENFPRNEYVNIPEGYVKLGKKDDDMYGWDSEYGHALEEVKEFRASKFLVSNLEYLEFV